MCFIYVKPRGNFPPPFITLILLLFPRAPHAHHLVCDPSLFYPFPIEYMLTFDARFYSNGNILGYTLLSSPFARVATTSLNSSLSFDLLRHYQCYQSFAGIQFHFAKWFDSIPFSVIWDILFYHGYDANFVTLLQHLYVNMRRCFRYAGCIGSFWQATNGLL